MDSFCNGSSERDLTRRKMGSVTPDAEISASCTEYNCCIMVQVARTKLGLALRRRHVRTKQPFSRGCARYESGGFSPPSSICGVSHVPGRARRRNRISTDQGHFGHGEGGDYAMCPIVSSIATSTPY